MPRDPVEAYEAARTQEAASFRLYKKATGRIARRLAWHRYTRAQRRTLSRQLALEEARRADLYVDRLAEQAGL